MEGGIVVLCKQQNTYQIEEKEIEEEAKRSTRERTLKLFEAGLQHQVLLHQLVGASHKRLQKILLVKRKARGLRPKNEQDKLHIRKNARGLPPRHKAKVISRSPENPRGLPPRQE